MKLRWLSPLLFLVLALLPLGAAAQDKATATLTLTVNAGTVTLTPSSLPNAEVGLAYSTTVTASGGLAPYVYSISTGSLPAGVTIASGTGVLSGTPTTAATVTFTVKATDSEVPAVAATQSYTVTVEPTLAITTTSLPAANIGVSYTASLVATGGVSPYTWAVTTGNLPAGLTLSSAGVISGTPTAAGSSTFTVTVTDSANNVVRLEIKTMIEVAAVVHKDNHA